MSETSECQNCLTPLKGAYCYECGQSVRGSDRFFLTLVNEAFEDIFSMNSRVWKTFGNLLWRPGFLSNEYFAGRRVRYIPPIRLYFTLSILFFLVYTISSFFDAEAVTVINSQDQSQGETPGEPTLAEESEEEVSENGESDKEQLEVSITDDENFDVPWLNDEEDAALKERIESQIEKAKEEFERDPDIVSDYFLDLAPPIIFSLLPLFALLLKIVYVTKGMYYTQHLVLAVHNHCFIFLWMTLIILITWAAESIGGLHGVFVILLFLWGPYYLWRSLRTVYKENRFFTFIKYMLLAISYWTLILFAAMAAIFFGIMTV